jgi:hypothetical protein
MRSRLPLVTVTLALSASVTACAAIWGFQDAIERHDADAELADATLDPGDSRVETSAAASSDATDAQTVGPTEGDAGNAFDAGQEAANADVDLGPADADAGQGPADADAGPGPADADAGPGPADADAGLDVTSADTGTDVLSPCSGACAPAPPTGWEGPFEIAEGNGGPLPSCNAVSWVDKYLLRALLNQAPATCTCSCGPPSGITCSAPTMNFFRRTDCFAGSACGQAPLDTCVAIANVPCPTPRGFQLGPSSASGGTCAAGSSTQLDPITWGAHARLCSPAAVSPNGCDPRNLCVPAVDPQFRNAFCVAAAAADAGACPTAYPVAHPGADAGGAGYYGNAKDERGCSPCTCSPATGATCADASALTYTASDTCTPRTDGVPVSAAAACTLVNGIVGAVFAGATPSGGMCVPSGGQPQGAIVATAPYTICCTQ